MELEYKKEVLAAYLHHRHVLESSGKTEDQKMKVETLSLLFSIIK